MKNKKIRRIIENNFTQPKPLFNINNIFDFLNDDKFTDGLPVDILRNQCKSTREEKILDQIRNKKILHIGFVDHLPIVDKKINNNKWFHGFLAKNSQRCVGIDINEEGVNYIKNKYGINDIYTCDITNPDLDLLLKEKFDVMILGEIIEHVDDPIFFLTKINKIYKNNVKKIIITTPNSLSYYNFDRAKRGYEMINSDHRTLFSYYTLIKTLHISGFKTEQISFTDPTHKLWHKILNRIIRKEIFTNKVQFSSTLVSISNFN